MLLKRSGEVLAVNPYVQRRFPPERRGQLVQLALLQLDTSPEGRLVRWAPEEGAAPWLVWITPMINGQREPTCWAVAVSEGESRHDLTAEILASLYRLTKAETRLALQVVEGKSPAEAASEMGVTIHTVRTYLKRLYLKAGVKSQAALVHKLMQTTNSNSGRA